MKSHKIITGLLALLLSALGASAQSFVDYGPAPRFLDLEVKAIAGRAMITENYLGCFPR